MRKNFIITSTAMALLCLAIAGHARDPIEDGKLQVKPAKDNKYEVGEYRFGKAEFFGYVGDLKESNKITGIVLKKGDQASAEQKHVIFITAQTQQIDAFIDEGGQVKPLIEAPATTPAPVPAGQ
jgi:hypothetical protein